MRRLAYFSPLPPAPTGVADYSLELLPYLGRQAELTLFCDGAVKQAIRERYLCEPATRYPDARWAFDVALFHMGNSRHHAGIYEMFRRYPGILVLHDTVLHHFVADHTAGQRNYAAYARELAYEEGLAGTARALAIQFAGAPHPLFAVPLVRRLVDLSLGVLVHSQTAARTIQALTSRPVGVVPALVEPHTGTSRRAALKLSKETVLFGSFGQVTAARQLDVVLEAFRALLADVPVHFLVVGDSHGEVDLPRLIADLDLAEHVTLLGRVPTLKDFVDWLASVDVVINLRVPTAGETSATALRALAAGKAMVTTSSGWYGELPAETAYQVQDVTLPVLLDAMQTLATDAQLRGAMGAAAQDYARLEHQGERAAEGYLDFVEVALEVARV